jgi:hypothetical protein
MESHDSALIIHLCYIVFFAVIFTQLFNFLYLRYVLSGIYDGNGWYTFYSQSFQIKLYSAFLLVQTLLLNGFIVYLNLFYFRDTFDYGKLIFLLGINFWIYKISESLIKGLNKSFNLTISLSKHDEDSEFIKINRTKVELKKPVNKKTLDFDGERIYLSAGKWVELDDLGLWPYRYAIYNLLKSHDKELVDSSSHIVYPPFIGIKIIFYSILLIFGILMATI